MKINAIILSIRAKYKKLPDQQKLTALIIALLFGCLLLVLLFKWVFAIIAHRKTTSAEPMIVRHENMITIPKSSPLRTQMKLTTVKISASPHIVSFPGIVEALPSRTVNILPPLPGRLIKLYAKLGDYVEKNQTLVVLRSPGLAQAYAEQEKALSTLNLARQTLKRAESVNKVGANAAKDIEQAQSNFIQALAELNRTNITIKTLGKNTFSLLKIKTPISGWITSLNYGKGSYINDTTTTLLTVSNTNKIWVTAHIPENLVGVISKDLPAEITLSAYPNEVLKGKVSFVNPYLEPESRRNKTRILLPNPEGKLQPNMFATVKIAVPQPDRLSIPISAILMHNDNTAVFVEKKPWTFERREVELGAEDRGKIRVLSGLNSGDRVVSSGGVLVND